MPLYLATDFSGIALKRTIEDAVPGNGISSETGTSLRLSFTPAVPLLQGRGKTVGTARETAARCDYEAARYELLHAISQAAYADFLSLIGIVHFFPLFPSDVVQAVADHVNDAKQDLGFGKDGLYMFEGYAQQFPGAGSTFND